MKDVGWKKILLDCINRLEDNVYAFNIYNSKDYCLVEHTSIPPEDLAAGRFSIEDFSILDNYPRCEYEFMAWGNKFIYFSSLLRSKVGRRHVGVSYVPKSHSIATDRVYPRTCIRRHHE